MLARRAEANTAAAVRRRREEEERSAVAERAAKRAAGPAANNPMGSLHAPRHGGSGGNGMSGGYREIRGQGIQYQQRYQQQCQQQQQRAGQPMTGSCSQPPARANNYNINHNNNINANTGNNNRPMHGLHQASYHNGVQQGSQPPCHNNNHSNNNSNGNHHQSTLAGDTTECYTRDGELIDQLSAFQFSEADVRRVGPAVREGERARGQGKIPALRCQQERELGEASAQLRYLIDMTIGRCGSAPCGIVM